MALNPSNSSSLEQLALKGLMMSNSETEEQSHIEDSLYQCWSQKHTVQVHDPQSQSQSQAHDVWCQFQSPSEVVLLQAIYTKQSRSLSLAVTNMLIALEIHQVRERLVSQTCTRDVGANILPPW